MKQNKMLIAMTGCLLFTITAMLYISFETQELRRELIKLQTSIKSERSRIHVIEADHAYLTRPSRVAELLSTYNSENLLSAPTPDQFINIDDLPFYNTGMQNASYQKD